MSAVDSYRPGSCNIGVQERRRRYVYAAAGFVVAAALVAAVAVGALPEALVPAVFVPLAVGIEWLLQASRSFCVVLGTLGKYSFEAAGEVGTVDDPDARREDRSSAIRITATSVVVAALLTAVAYVAV
ncbi:hypothetical protein EFA46_011835 (plasmid) [Halarchaeum sp. CBA1220]|uniref:hypothetical protein n=1 Tax=Halarchaeum sp. CBA1220 TaxID=1853682 RepID=UPI000F3A992B|nr:hypothetical protein [Halarchaeum sp. CBA1220]QLC34943.1 hypothetical protein EFA46_011835 [Halarchaeum sp. CBA1220]